jgi:chaperonin GroES
MDADGDGYAEPYAITIELSSRKVLRIVARFDDEQAIRRTPSGEVHSIEPTEYFTKYEFIPSPDGGIYGIGLGNLLGPLNESTNSLINQLIDAGTMSTAAGGFLGRGAKMRGGVYTFSPLEWKRVDSTGDDLRKSIFPLPVREPSNVLFQLLSLLIDYTNRISGTTDTMVGENPGQNTPAATTQTMVEQGQKIYSAIFKRVWRSMKEEFRKLYKLNSVFLPISQAFGEEGLKALRSDYLGATERLVPAVDPHVVSDQQRLQKAMALKQAAMTTTGYNLEAVERNYLSAMQIDGVEALYPGPGKVPPLPNPKAMIEQAKLQIKEKDLKLKEMMFMAELMEERRLNGAKIVELEAKAMMHMAEAQGVDAGHKIAAFEAALGALKHHDESLNKRIELMMKSLEKENDGQASNGAGMGGMAGASSNQSAAPLGAGPGLGV